MNEEKLEQEAVETETSESQESQTDTEADSSETSGETEEASSSDAEDAPEDKWLRPGRFKTAEDALQSYDQLESHTSRVQNELYRLKQQLEGQQQTKPRTEDEINDFAKQAEKNPVEAIRNLARQEANVAREEVRALQFQQKYDSYRQNEEFRQLEPKMTQIAQHFQQTIQQAGMQNDPQLLDALWLMAKGASTSEAAAKAEAKGKKKGEATAVKKMKAQVEGASGTKGKSNIKIEDLTAEQMKKAIERGDISI